MNRLIHRFIPLLLCCLVLVSCEERSVSMRSDSLIDSRDISKGSGLLVVEGSVITTHYTVKLPNGTTVIDTRATGKSHMFIVGGGTVVSGMDKLVRGMRTGGIREGRIPPKLHYGAPGYGGKIPANTVLTFRVEVIDVRTG